MSSEKDAAMETIADWLGAKQPRVLVACQIFMVQYAKNVAGFHDVTAESLKKSFDLADTFIRWDKEHPPK